MAGGRIRTDGHLLLPKHPRVLPPSIYVCIIPHNILIVNKMMKKGPQNCGGLSIRGIRHFVRDWMGLTEGQTQRNPQFCCKNIHLFTWLLLPSVPI